MIIDSLRRCLLQYSVGHFVRSMMFPAIILCCLLSTSGCSSVPTLSQNGYDQAVALMSICNRQSEQGLVILKQSIEKSMEQGELPGNEGKLLLKVIKLGESGDWNTAKSRARAIMDRQKSYKPR